MIDLATFTAFHVLISLVGIVTGLIALYGMLTGARMDTMTLAFLVTTAGTTITGFLFSLNGFTPAVITGIISAALLFVAFAGRYLYGLAGLWRLAYVITATAALYLNVFVLVVQSFLKIPTLNNFAPTGSEPPFAITQLVVLLAFIAGGVLAARRFRPVPVAI
jgi:hypothetical protein